MDTNALREIVDTVIREMSAESDISLNEARVLSKKVREKAAAIGVNAVVAVSNKAGHPVLVECMDNSFIASYDIAVNKAFTVVSLKMSTYALKSLSQPGGSLYGIQFTNNGKIVIFGGGEPLCSGDKIIGGLGVSGGSEEQDTALAEYGQSVFSERQ